MNLLFLVGPLLLQSTPLTGAALRQISKDHPVYVEARGGDVLSITKEHRMGSDPDVIYIYGPDGKLQERLELTGDTTVEVPLSSGSGSYKILPVNYTYVHSFAIKGEQPLFRPMVVEPLAHEEWLRGTGSTDFYFHVPRGTKSMVFHASSMWSAGPIKQELFDPRGSLVHTFELPRHTYQQQRRVRRPKAGFWRCRFTAPTYDRFGAWLEGVPNYFSATPATWFQPTFPDSRATLQADATEVVSTGARVGVNWWLNPAYPEIYRHERKAVIEARMDTARISVHWAFREPSNDNGDPFLINWNGFDFEAHDQRMAAYSEDIVQVLPEATPVLLFYWDSAVSWQAENPANWGPAQREEYAEFVLATMLHTVAPELQDPPGSTPAYDFHHVELLNEPNLSMGSSHYQEYIEVVKTVGQRLRRHHDPRIQKLKIIASGIGGVWGEGEREMENWIGKLIDQADPYVDGINWHQYDYIRLEENGRYAEDILKVKGWLATRGDKIPDELILMTETNQHGGPPTCFQRQDTFHAALWWAGTSFAALRGGADYLHFYKLVDDPPGSYNYKGMLFNHGPYDPPVFPGGAAFASKPIHSAAGFINKNRHEQVLLSTCDHAEIAQLVTRSNDFTRITVLLANLFDRTIATEVRIQLPEQMQDRAYSTNLRRIDAERPGNPKLGPALRSQRPPLIALKETVKLAPRSIYALEFRARPR